MDSPSSVEASPTPRQQLPPRRVPDGAIWKTDRYELETDPDIIDQRQVLACIAEANANYRALWRQFRAEAELETNLQGPSFWEEFIDARNKLIRDPNNAMNTSDSQLLTIQR